jgi:hypothetical protein
VDKECFNILIFCHNTSKSRHLRIPKKTVKIATYLLAFSFLCVTFFFCDYIQVKKKAYELSQLREETQEQRSQIHFFSAHIENLEKQLSKLKDLDKRIRIIANLENGQETTPFIGMGGPSPSDIRDKLKTEKDPKALVRQMEADVNRFNPRRPIRRRPLSSRNCCRAKRRCSSIAHPSGQPSGGHQGSAAPTLHRVDPDA